MSVGYISQILFFFVLQYKFTGKFLKWQLFFCSDLAFFIPDLCLFAVRRWSVLLNAENEAEL